MWLIPGTQKLKSSPRPYDLVAESQTINLYLVLKAIKTQMWQHLFYSDYHH